MSFPARYPGTCGECGGPFQVDDTVVYDASDELCHFLCPPEPPPAPTCSTCFLALPVSGVCEECA